MGDVVAIPDSVGIKADEAKLNALFADVGKLECSVDDAIAQGMAKLSVIPSGGSGPAVADVANDNTQKTLIEQADDAADDSESKSSSVRGGGLFDNNSDDSSSDGLLKITRLDDTHLTFSYLDYNATV